MKVLLIINPKAGGNDHSETIQALQELFQTHGFDPQYYLTTGEDDERKIKKKIDKVKPECVVAAGGDGTIQLVAKILLPYKLSMGILPLGSANGLATALEIPKDPLAAADNIIKSTKVRPVDMLRFNGKDLCIHLSDIGVNALIVKKYEDAGERGFLGYAKYLLASIQETPLYNITIRTPEETIQKAGYMMAFANAHKYGTGVQISEGSVSDGMFEICNVEQVSLDEAIRAGLTILNVFVDKDMFSDVITCREAEISIDQKAHFQIDGEYMGMVDHLHIEIVPGALKLIV
ncbi:MAG TPA: diacylglycerol kinase family protein [Chryseosolibacter sp.]|nr:diacylglycerol kinase family protein [Chryseosolibacter sp.]